jgi:hypothetical protein
MATQLTSSEATAAIKRKVKDYLCKHEGCGETDPKNFYPTTGKSLCKKCHIIKTRAKREADKLPKAKIPEALPTAEKIRLLEEENADLKAKLEMLGEFYPPPSLGPQDQKQPCDEVSQALGRPPIGLREKKSHT